MIPMGLPTTQHQLFPCVQGRQTYPKPITLNRSHPIVESYVHLVSTISNVSHNVGMPSLHVTPMREILWCVQLNAMLTGAQHFDLRLAQSTIESIETKHIIHTLRI
jgi:hypothetical protein